MTAENPDLALIKALAQAMQPGPTLQACACGVSLTSSRPQPLGDRLGLGHGGGGSESPALSTSLLAFRLCKAVPSSGASTAVLGQITRLETEVQMPQSLQIAFEKDWLNLFQGSRLANRLTD